MGTPQDTSGENDVVVEVKKPNLQVQPGKTLGRYRLDEIIGHGAFSTVFKGHDTALDLPVVVKVLGHDASADAVERFRREIVFSRRVAHPGFARIFELHEEQSAAGPLRYLTLEVVSGRTLGDLMNEGPLPERRALTIARDLCDIVAAAHDQGVVHGDLKPSNVMVRHSPRLSLSERRQEPRDNLVILDFGAASAVDMADPGVRVGSVRYMAPELFEGAGISAQTDVWAIGVVLYACLTGRFPYDGEGDRAVAEATRRTLPTAPSSLSPRLSPLIDPVVLKALRRNRNERYPDCRAFRRALDEVLFEVRQPSLWQRFLRRLRP